jgi:hypothetical protein
MNYLRCFPVLSAERPAGGGLLGIRSTIARVCVLAYVLGLCWPAIAQTATTTTLTLTSGGSAVTTVETGTVVTLTATVTAGSTPVTPGTVNFCDATAAHCTDIHIVGSAQLTRSGTAVFKFRPGLGSRSYKAVFVGTKTYAGSLTSAASLTVVAPVGGVPTTTTIAPTGTSGDYLVIATVSAFSPGAAPTGTVSFLDASNGNRVLETAGLAAGPNWLASNSSFYPAGSSPGAVTSADFNGDGVPDLAIIDAQGATVFVLLGNGDGTFPPAIVTPITAEGPYRMVTGDFNGDGIPDLAYLSYSADLTSTDVSILLGNGDGTFTAGASYTAGSLIGEARLFAVADFNQDGILDLAIPNAGANSMTILLGNGDGTFTQTRTSPPTGDQPEGAAVGDFNGDGIPDLAVTDTGSASVTILLGNGDGTFTSSTFPEGADYLQDPIGIAAADFNGDGIPDLTVETATVNGGPNRVLIFIGKGDGTFTSTGQLLAEGVCEQVVLADFNGDGIPDIAIPDILDVTVLIGNGDGTFTAAVNPPLAPNSGSGLAVVDLNGDGVPDLAVISDWNVELVDTVSILLTSNTQTGAVDVASLAGSNLVEASYSGDSKYSSSISAPLSVETGGPVPAALFEPAPGQSTVLRTSNVGFEWTAGTGVTLYKFTLGDTGAGSSDLFSYTGSATSVTVPTLSPNGEIVYARLYSQIDGAWQYNDYLYTESGPAVLETPFPSLATILGTSNVTFEWTNGTGVALYQFTLGTTGIGSSNLFSYTGTATSVTVPTLPANGETVYATLYSEVSGTWLQIDDYYTESNAAVLTSPTPGLGTVLGTSDVGFQWTAGAAVTVYELDLGTLAPGARDLYVYKGTGTSTIVPSLPAHGETVYARLYSYISNVWQFSDYVYTESGTLVPAVLTSPTPGLSTVLGTSGVTFQWSSGTGANLYQLNLSATVPGGSDLYLYKGTATSTTVPSIPANGAIVYARLYSSLNGKWIFDDTAYYSDYVYTESGSTVAAILTFPSPGLTTVLGTSDVLFQWTGGAGATLYQLNLSAIAPGGEDLYVYKGTATSTSAPSLPANGVKVYARLYSYINKAWRYNDYVYTEQ